MRPALLLTLMLLTQPLVTPAHAGEITVYRCTDANGRVSLRDTPCPGGQQQTTREMLRPKDPPPRAATAPAATTTPAAAPPPQPPRVVVVRNPEPVYECITPDGERYTSPNADGNPRWVPLWTLGYPTYPIDPGHRGGVHGRVDMGGGSVRGRVEFGGHAPPRPPLVRPTPPPSDTVAAFPTGTWIRDACTRLPQAEVCARLRDRRHALDRRYNSALQSERHRITDEQRLIDAQLDEDCDGG
ncbi:DUF4124 domain-containing protein [Aerolutibacter ruishenii]|uniref:Uncharacterized protein DUF4124 n=1 Tax=Aerolutibacter ruishenii TaxID=686800 RepID=A0A562M3D9_9GAMM|nr:DUF4124 domain-containing protein [Lysobacter ruishenii]TWI14454.1 uncharacterized protein DUF4124 [Lysobacter ruishenii]